MYKEEVCKELSEALDRDIYYYPKDRAFVWDEEDEEGNIETLYVNQYLPMGKWLPEKHMQQYAIDVNFWLSPKALMELAKFYVELEKEEDN